MTTAVITMADVLGSQKTTSHGLEKLSVPTWDGNRKSWKSEFNFWIYKYKQDEDEQLQRLRKALPKNSFGLIKCGQARKSSRRGKFLILNLEIKGN